MRIGVDESLSHPFLEGADGIALDALGNIWVAANERDAVIFLSYTPDSRLAAAWVS